MTSDYKHIVTILLSLTFLLGLTSCADDLPIQEEVKVDYLENEVLQSKLLNRPVNYSVLLPEEYFNTTDSFPVVYLLHGFGDNHNAWYNGGRIRYYSERMGTDIVPMIFVMMDGYNSYYVDKYNDRFPYMQMITSELVPEIDSIYRTGKSSSQRAVMGYSMGGYGAIILPIMNPDIFGISVPLSMSFRTDEQYISESNDGWNYQWGSIFGGSGSLGEDRLTEYYKEHNPFYLFKKSDLSVYHDIRFLICCGDDEGSLHIPNGELHNLMRKNEIKHEFRVGDGGHSWDYWHSNLSEALSFISYGFQEQEYSEIPEPVSIDSSFPSEQYSLVTLAGSSLQLGIFKPAKYDSTDLTYPSIFILHDNEESDKDVNRTKLLSLLNSKMEKGYLQKSLVVEIPLNQEDISIEVMEMIIEYIGQNFRVVDDKKARVLMANGVGGSVAINLLPGFKERFNACFLYNAQMPLETTVTEGIYYYIDITDKADMYEENFNLYVSIRENGNDYEYRVRQGNESYQSFLNGLDGSIRYMYKRLKT